jgi:hypothetical protein
VCRPTESRGHFHASLARSLSGPGVAYYELQGRTASGDAEIGGSNGIPESGSRPMRPTQQIE